MDSNIRHLSCQFCDKLLETVMTSSIFLVMVNVGSVTVCGPTRKCPYSMYVTTSFKCSANFSRTKAVESRHLYTTEKIFNTV
ncbi:unnamed protein product [Lupinus luteus]|uniref:Uncharacterized protein n=1 Tax=Lupinus luteus TaxID=3873 RepID=A0AAV1XX63_LUPLU